ncbi:hypothetical protein CHUAL_007521 [Chamberlinius hualienensis]
MTSLGVVFALWLTWKQLLRKEINRCFENYLQLTTVWDSVKTAKTLLCFLQALEEKEVIVELRNESTVTGVLVNVDSHMNLLLSKATFSQWGSCRTKHFDDLFIKGKQIRYVQSVDQLDVQKTLQKQLNCYKKRD